MPSSKKYPNVNFCNNQTIDSLNGNENSTTFNCAKYSQKVLQNLKILQMNSKLCDVDIIVGDKIIKAHRNILAAGSLYFQAMFTSGLAEQEQRSIEFHSISPDTLEYLLEFIYTGAIKINTNNVHDIIVCADMLEVNDVVEICSDFISGELHPSNAIGIYRFADAHHFNKLIKVAGNYIHSNFAEVTAEDEWVELPQEHLMKFLASEQLRIDSERTVLTAAMRWISYSAAARRRFVFDILRNVRLPLLNLSLLEQTIDQVEDASLRVALRSCHADLVLRRGSLVPLAAQPRRAAYRHIYIIGGSKRERANTWQRAERAFTDVERFSAWRTEWTRCASLSTRRILPGVAALNDFVYAVGGEEQDGRILDSGERYDPQIDVWTSINSMAIPRCEFGMCAIKGSLYAFGGWLGHDIGTLIERFDPREGHWHNFGNLPEHRFSAGVVTYRDQVYLVGGCSQNERHLSELLCFDPRAVRWRRLTPMLMRRSQMGVAVLDNALYVAGGRAHQQLILDSVEKYNFKEDTWNTVKSMTFARGSLAAAAADGRLYVFGGDTTLSGDFYRAQESLDTVESYDPINDVWSKCTPLSESRAEFGAVVI